MLLLLLHLGLALLHGDLFFFDDCLQSFKLILLLFHLLFALFLLFEGIHNDGLSFNFFFLYLLDESILSFDLCFLAVNEDLLVFEDIIRIIQFEVLSFLHNALVFLVQEEEVVACSAVELVVRRFHHIGDAGILPIHQAISYKLVSRIVQWLHRNRLIVRPLENVIIIFVKLLVVPVQQEIGLPSRFRLTLSLSLTLALGTLRLHRLLSSTGDYGSV